MTMNLVNRIFFGDKRVPKVIGSVIPSYLGILLGLIQLM
jgi:hypothetical protein